MTSIRLDLAVDSQSDSDSACDMSSQQHNDTCVETCLWFSHPGFYRHTNDTLGKPRLVGCHYPCPCGHHASTFSCVFSPFGASSSSSWSSRSLTTKYLYHLSQIVRRPPQDRARHNRTRVSVQGTMARASHTQLQNVRSWIAKNVVHNSCDKPQSLATAHSTQETCNGTSSMMRNDV